MKTLIKNAHIFTFRCRGLCRQAHCIVGLKSSSYSVPTAEANLPDPVQRLFRMRGHEKRFPFPYYSSFVSIQYTASNASAIVNRMTYTFGGLSWNSVRPTCMGLFLKILNRLHFHCMVQSISYLKINRWPHLNVALSAIVNRGLLFYNS